MSARHPTPSASHLLAAADLSDTVCACVPPVSTAYCNMIRGAKLCIESCDPPYVVGQRTEWWF